MSVLEGDAVSIEVVHNILLALVLCVNGATRDDDDRAKKNDDVTKFAARSHTFLLQHRPSGANSSYSSTGDVFVVYGQCLLTCLECMIGSESSRDSFDNQNVPASAILAIKLLPKVLSSVVHRCETPSGEGETENVETCGSEFNQFVSRLIPFVMSFASGRGRHVTQLHRVALESIPKCIPVVQESLQIQYRNSWGSILPGGYATFTTALAMSLLELKGVTDSVVNTKDHSTEGEIEVADLETKLRSWIKTMVLSLLRLRHDVEKDTIARNAVEYACSTCV